MSLYYVQKLLYQLNRDPLVRKRFETNRDELLHEYVLSDEERGAIVDGDIGLLYVMGVNGQILMHYSALIGQPWDEYIAAMRAGVQERRRRAAADRGGAMSSGGDAGAQTAEPRREHRESGRGRALRVARFREVRARARFHVGRWRAVRRISNVALGRELLAAGYR